MSNLVHVGVRPEYEIREVDRFGVNRIYREERPDGSYKIWNERQLESGCGFGLTKVVEADNLLFCRYCDEWFSKDQFKERDDETKS